MNASAALLLLANAAASLYMVGVIWTVQLAHYFLFDRVGEAGWAAYHGAHTRQMGLVVMLPMLVQLGTAGLLALDPPPGLPRPLAWAGLALAALTWAVTFLVSVPLHGRLSSGYDREAMRALLNTNWLRTLLWTGHGAVAVEMLRRLLMLRP